MDSEDFFAMSFSADLTKFAAKANANVDTVVRKVTFDLARAVIRRTPVDTGHARGQWQVGRSLHHSPGKGDTDASWVKAGDTIFISNNTEYILPLEYGRSKQAPHGMVRVSVQMFTDYINRAARSL